MVEGFDPEFATPSEWARLYRSSGIQVVPAFMPGESKGGWKRPLLKTWTEYQHALVPDEVFTPWYGSGGLYVGRLNMGAICGQASGNLFVIDLDTYKIPAAAAWWQGLLAVHNNSMELETVEQRTGGGGLQKLFHAPTGWVPPTCKTPIGIDIRGQGGFAMLCPSMHESGRAYEWLDGRSPDEIEIMMAPTWLLEAVTALVKAHGGGASTTPPGAEGYGQSKNTSTQSYTSGQYDGFGHQTDGREQKMTELIWGAVIDWRRDWARPGMPDDAQIRQRCAEKYLVYEGLVSAREPHPAGMSKTDALEAEGRGTSLFWRKWQYAMRQWEGDVTVEAGKPNPGGYTDRPNPGGYTDFTDEFAKASNNAKAAGGIYPFLDVDQIMNKPDPVWMVNDIINERALGFIFGPPGSLKTFIALDLALSIAAKAAAWWNKPINRHGAVVYLCREGTSSFKLRIQAWEAHRKMTARGTPFLLIEHPTNFMNPEDVGKVVATIEAIMAHAGVPIAAVFVDTVSRVLPGAEENLQRDMSLFVAACEHIQMVFGCIVVGLHHTNKNGQMRGSTVIPGAGDFLIEVRREPGAKAGSIVLQKVKDGEDGIETPFKTTTIEIHGIVPRSSLVVDPTEIVVVKGTGSDWPDIMVCRDILAALDQQWWKKQPWCYASNTSRSAVTNIMNRWNLKRSVVKDMLNKWTANGIIEEVECDPHTHLKGYKKLTNI